MVEVVDEWSEGACRVALLGVEAEGGGFGEMVAAMQAVSEQGVAGIRGTSHPGNGEVAVGGIGEAGGNQFATLENHPGAARIEKAWRFGVGGLKPEGKLRRPQGGPAKQRAQFVEMTRMGWHHHGLRAGIWRLAECLTPGSGIRLEKRPGCRF